MAERHYARVKAELLRWAREASGLDLEAAAKRLAVKSARLAEWERGSRLPTVPQLRSAAAVYKRPLAVFFRRTVPETPAPLHDFRRLHGGRRSTASYELRLEMRRARRRRSIALDLLAETDSSVPIFDLRAELSSNPEIIAERAREWLGLRLLEQEKWRSSRVALRAWISALESRGVLVFQTSDIPLSEMRGFSISERKLPVIVLNTKDLPLARIFTLMHEFTHLMLSRGGICDSMSASRRTRTLEEQTEVFSNHVAGAILVPRDALLQDTAIAGQSGIVAWEDTVIQRLSARFQVSREVIVRRLLIFERASETFYERKRRQYQAQHEARAELQRERERERRGHPPLPVLAVRDNGRRYTRLVLEALAGSRITEADISDYLGVRLKHLEGIADVVEEQALEM